MILFPREKKGLVPNRGSVIPSGAAGGVKLGHPHLRGSLGSSKRGCKGTGSRAVLRAQPSAGPRNWGKGDERQGRGELEPPLCVPRLPEGRLGLLLAWPSSPTPLQMPLPMLKSIWADFSAPSLPPSSPESGTDVPAPQHPTKQPGPCMQHSPVLGAGLLLLSPTSPCRPAPRAAPRPAASYTCPGPPPAPGWLWLEMSRGGGGRGILGLESY